LEIESITFKNSNGRDLLDLSGMKGKKKNGAMKLEPESALCRVHCKNGKQFVIRSVVRGILIEGNHRLVSNPSLLTNKPRVEGYVAIMKPFLDLKALRESKQFLDAATYGAQEAQLVAEAKAKGAAEAEEKAKQETVKQESVKQEPGAVAKVEPGGGKAEAGTAEPGQQEPGAAAVKTEGAAAAVKAKPGAAGVNAEGPTDPAAAAKAEGKAEVKAEAAAAEVGAGTKEQVQVQEETAKEEKEKEEEPKVEPNAGAAEEMQVEQSS
jgi:hypothetical protein